MTYSSLSQKSQHMCTFVAKVKTYVHPNFLYYWIFCILLKRNEQWALSMRVYHKNTFFTNKLCPTHQASAWGLVWRNPKGFLISTKFRGSSSHFRFDHFYIVYFHSAPTFLDWDLRSKGWVKIYNVKMVKTEMARGPPKLCRNQKSFWILSN